MSYDWAQDVRDMHEKFGFTKWRDELATRLEQEDDARAQALFKKLLAFRLTMMGEELNETLSAMLVQEDPEEVVDGLIDIIVFAIGTLDLLDVDAHLAWQAIHNANMAKQAGVKPGRPNRFGLPDLMKPDGWQAPSHAGNHGILPSILQP